MVGWGGVGGVGRGGGGGGGGGAPPPGQIKIVNYIRYKS
jgi:hypothetical protein